jgi:hypothetical protein
MEGLIKNIDETSRASFFNQLTPSIVEQRIENRKPIFLEEYGNIVLDSGVSYASFFANQPSLLETEAQNFKAFISNRKNYIDRLKFLGPNWINGKSLPPNESAIKIGNEILGYLEEWYSTEKPICYYSFPQVIMGPIPSGGLTIEIIPQGNVKLFINIYNDENIEMEIDSEGYFSDIESNPENYKTNLAKFLSQYTLWDDYSRWGNSISIC